MVLRASIKTKMVVGKKERKINEGHTGRKSG
jgi:hypothetical protein